MLSQGRPVVSAGDVLVPGVVYGFVGASEVPQVLRFRRGPASLSLPVFVRSGGVSGLVEGDGELGECVSRFGCLV